MKNPILLAFVFGSGTAASFYVAQIAKENSELQLLALSVVSVLIVFFFMFSVQSAALALSKIKK